MDKLQPLARLLLVKNRARIEGRGFKLKGRAWQLRSRRQSRPRHKLCAIWPNVANWSILQRDPRYDLVSKNKSASQDFFVFLNPLIPLCN